MRSTTVLCLMAALLLSGCKLLQPEADEPAQPQAAPVGEQAPGASESEPAASAPPWESVQNPPALAAGPIQVRKPAEPQRQTAPPDVKLTQMPQFPDPLSDDPVAREQELNRRQAIMMQYRGQAKEGELAALELAIWQLQQQLLALGKTTEYHLRFAEMWKADRVLAEERNKELAAQLEEERRKREKHGVPVRLP